MHYKLSDTKEYIHHLYAQGRFKHMLEHSHQALTMALKSHSYSEALIFYKNMMEAYCNLGQIPLLHETLIEYKELCRMHGTLEDKMHYHRFSAVFHASTNNVAFAVKAYKCAIHYAHELNDEEILAICYALISNAYINGKEMQQATFAMKLAQHYSLPITDQTDAMLRVNIALMHTYAQLGMKEEFTELEDKTMELIGSRPLHFLFACMKFSEGRLLYNLHDSKGSVVAFKKGLELLDPGDQFVYLQHIYQYILHHQLDIYFPKGYIRTQLEVMEVQMNAWRKNTQREGQPFHYDVGIAYEDNHMLFDSLSLMGVPRLSEVVNKKLLKGESCACLLFSLHDSQSDAHPPHQLTYAAFIIIQDLLKSVPHIFSRKEHEEGIIILFNDIDAENIIYSIYQKIRKTIGQTDSPSNALPIHFGLAYSKEMKAATFEKLYAKASACHYYAHSTNKLYIT
ncbi:MAG: hypothetical protein ACI33P_06880 [Lysinibacillus sp.]